MISTAFKEILLKGKVEIDAVGVRNNDFSRMRKSITFKMVHNFHHLIFFIIQKTLRMIS